MGQWLIPCLLSSCPVGQMAGSWGWLHEDIRVVAQGVMLGITQRSTLEHEAGAETGVLP